MAGSTGIKHRQKSHQGFVLGTKWEKGHFFTGAACEFYHSQIGPIMLVLHIIHYGQANAERKPQHMVTHQQRCLAQSREKEAPNMFALLILWVTKDAIKRQNMNICLCEHVLPFFLSFFIALFLQFGEALRASTL